MPEIIENKQVFTLLEVTRSVKKTLEERYTSAFWVKAEMSKLNHYTHSGHCYPDLVQKNEGKVIAQIRANLWADDYSEINERFQRVMKEPLRDGIKILFLARITFDPFYGLALRILDIDPDYTLGDLEREKRETIERLKTEGIFHQNRGHQIPLLPQRIAIVSVETSNGYADFKKVLDTNPWGYKFFHLLFPSLLQGERAVASIIYQLERIKKVKSHFDVVAIIRGGGGEVGLSCFNHYELVRQIALFPLPVLTGIGHATNETVAEMVSYSNEITPTKMAEYLLQRFHDFSGPLQKAGEKINERSKGLLLNERVKFKAETRQFRYTSQSLLERNQRLLKERILGIFQQTQFMTSSEKKNLHLVTMDIQKGSKTVPGQEKKNVVQLVERMAHRLRIFFPDEHVRLTHLKKNIENMSPEKVLKRGYSLTLVNGKSVSSITEVKVGDEIETLVSDGSLISTVIEKKTEG